MHRKLTVFKGEVLLQLVGVMLVKPKITCFMIVRNALNQGYPFLEAIAQALPVCDEMLIGDGGSTEWNTTNLGVRARTYQLTNMLVFVHA